MTACASPPPATGHGNETGQGHETGLEHETGQRGETAHGDDGRNPTGGKDTRGGHGRNGGKGGNVGSAPPGCVITADGSYAARLALDGESWFPERWTLDGPEPYAVPLPGNQPEEPGTEVLPMTDGRVLIHRLAAGRHLFSLLYPTGPGTGELPLGAVECADPAAELRLLSPAPCGERAYALALGRSATTVWLVAGGAFGPELLAQVPGRCSGGVWLDGTGRMLALDQESGGRTKSVVVDLEQGGAVSPLLQIADDSNDRVLLADPDSGLLLIRSDAPSPGHDRLGWGVLGSTLPVRFPECLRVPDGHRITPSPSSRARSSPPRAARSRCASTGRGAAGSASGGRPPAGYSICPLPRAGWPGPDCGAGRACCNCPTRQGRCGAGWLGWGCPGRRRRKNLRRSSGRGVGSRLGRVRGRGGRAARKPCGRRSRTRHSRPGRRAGSRPLRSRPVRSRPRLASPGPCRCSRRRWRGEYRRR